MHGETYKKVHRLIRAQIQTLPETAEKRVFRLISEGGQERPEAVIRDSIARLEAELETDPDSGDKHTYLAECYEELGEYNLAVEHYQTALTKKLRDSSRIEVLLDMSNLCSRADRAEQALQVFEEYRREAGGPTPVDHFRYGELLQEAGEEQRALSFFITEVERDSRNIGVYNRICDILERSGKNDLMQDFCREMLEKNPGSAMAKLVHDCYLGLK